MASHKAGFFLHVARMPGKGSVLFSHVPFFFFGTLQSLLSAVSARSWQNPKSVKESLLLKISFTSSSASTKTLNSEMIFDKF